MEFCLLGPIQVWSAGRRIDLGARSQRLVLAILLLEVGRLVPTDRLVELVWPQTPPPSARRTLQAHVSRLRTTLAANDGARPSVALTRHGDCYQLLCDPEQVDANVFRGLVALARQAGSDQERAELLDRALWLWRGPVLADVGSEESRQRLGGGLQALHLATLEERAEVHLRLGRHVTVVDELSDLTVRYPHRQRITAALMHAHYSAGDAANALAVYRRARRWLSDELGLEPPSELQQLHAAILRGVPAPHLLVAGLGRS